MPSINSHSYYLQASLKSSKCIPSYIPIYIYIKHTFGSVCIQVIPSGERTRMTAISKMSFCSPALWYCCIYPFDFGLVLQHSLHEYLNKIVEEGNEDVSLWKLLSYNTVNVYVSLMYTEKD